MEPAVSARINLRTAETADTTDKTRKTVGTRQEPVDDMKNTLTDGCVTKKGRRKVDAMAENARLNQVQKFDQSPVLEAWFLLANVCVQVRKVD
jgi:hypothetical protein